MVTVVRSSRLRAGMSRNELGAAAGVAPSTVTRIERGQLNPTIDLVERLVAAAGFRLTTTIEAVADLAAARTARSILEADYPFPPDPTWVARWEAMKVLRGGSPRAVDLLLRRAGGATDLLARPGARRWLAGRATPSEVAAAVAKLLEGTDGWAITGPTAANRLAPVTGARWLVLYAPDPAGLAGTLGWKSYDTPGIRGEEVTPVLVLPSGPEALWAATADAEGARWAAPVQVSIDCYAGWDRMPDQADAVVASMLVDA